MRKRGLSPTVATVLLVALVVVIMAIIFLWFKNLNEETLTKFEDENVKISCKKVELEVSYSPSSKEVLVKNIGDVPVAGFRIKTFSDGENDLELEEFEGIVIGGSDRFNISPYIHGNEKILLIPVLLANSDEGSKEYVCDEDRGYEIKI